MWGTISSVGAECLNVIQKQDLKEEFCGLEGKSSAVNMKR
jgi:hypothetical protein